LSDEKTAIVYRPIRGQKQWWSMIEFGSSISSGVLDTYLVAFYMFTVLGNYVGPGAVVRAGLIGVVVFLGKIIQGLANLPVAQISDRISTRWGRRRVFVLFGCVPWGISVFMLFFVPSTLIDIFETSLLISIGWLAIWFVFHNIMNAAVINPYLAMLPEIAKTSLERTQYQQWRILFTFLAIVIAAITWPLIGETLGAPLVAGLMIFTALIMVLGSREDVSVQPATISFKESATTVLENQAFRRYIVTIMGWMAASSMSLAMLPIFVEGFFGISLDSDEIVPWIGLEPSIVMAIVSGIFLITAVSVLPFIGFIQKKIGKKKSFQLYMVLFGIFIGSISIIGLLPGTPNLASDPYGYFQFSFIQLIFLILLTGIPAGGVGVIMYSVFADVIDNDQFGDQERRESMYFAVQGVFDWGAASAGSLILGIILTIFGSSDFGGAKDAGLLGTGSLGLRIIVLLTAVIMFFAAFIFRKYPLDD
jgi:GPH family glycoside/pentoside/hexuronide:cation symporter